MKIESQVLQPVGYSTFSCIADKCQYSCCLGWHIAVDKKTFKKYRALHDETLNQGVRKQESPTRDNYGYIHMDEQRRCGYLTEEGLCSLQKKYGPDMLCTTCQRYPRVLFLTGNSPSRTLQLSCEAVCQHFLTGKEPLAFELVPETFTGPLKLDRHLTMDDPANPLKNHFFTLRSTMIDVLQNRMYGISDRLILVGMMLEKVHNLSINGEAEKIDAYCRGFLTATGEGTLADSLRGMSRNLNIHLGTGVALLGIMKNRNRNINMVLEKYLHEALELLHISEEYADADGSVDFQKVEPNYAVGLAGFDAFFEENSHILENILVMLVFEMLMPFTLEDNVFNSYALLCSLFALLRMLLSAMYLKHGKLEERTVLDAVVQVMRLLGHNPYVDTVLVRTISQLYPTNFNFMMLMVK